MAESPEKAETNGKALGLKLVGHLEAILAQEGLAPEISYRLGKIRQGLLPLLDRLYLKTSKGQEMLGDCLEKTRALQGRLPEPAENFYALLTDLEKTYEDLLRMIYAFRVKAG